MKKSYLFTSLILLVSPISWSAPMTGGAIEFKGYISASTCKIDSPYVNVKTLCANGLSQVSVGKQKNNTTPFDVHTRQLSLNHYINDIVYL